MAKGKKEDKEKLDVKDIPAKLASSRALSEMDEKQVRELYFKLLRRIDTVFQKTADANSVKKMLCYMMYQYYEQLDDYSYEEDYEEEDREEDIL